MVFARLSGLQENGWHSGLESLAWITDESNGGLFELDWVVLRKELLTAKGRITEQIIKHAKDNGEFFTQTPEPESETGMYQHSGFDRKSSPISSAGP